MLPSNRMAAILNQAWLQSKVKKVSPKNYSACGTAVQPQLNRGSPSPYSRFSWGLTAVQPRFNLGFTVVFVRLFLDSPVSNIH